MVVLSIDESVDQVGKSRRNCQREKEQPCCGRKMKGPEYGKGDVVAGSLLKPSEEIDNCKGRPEKIAAYREEYPVRPDASISVSTHAHERRRSICSLHQREAPGMILNQFLSKSRRDLRDNCILHHRLISEVSVGIRDQSIDPVDSEDADSEQGGDEIDCKASIRNRRGSM